MLVEAIKGTIYLEVNITFLFAMAKLESDVNHKEVTRLCQTITQGEFSGGYSGL